MTTTDHRVPRSFLVFWTVQLTSQLGSQIIKLALPTIAITALNAGEAEAGYLSAAGLAAFLLVGLPAGAWIDQRPKRRVLISALVVRSGVFSLIPALYFAGHLELWTMYLVAFVYGVTSVLFDVASQSLLPSLVDRARIAEANGRLEATQQVAALLGPVLVGTLLGVVASPLAFIVAVAIFALSALLLVRLAEGASDQYTPRGLGPLTSTVSDGLRWVFGHRLLRRLIVTSALMNMSTGIVSTLLPVYLLRNLGYPPTRLGLLLALGAAGGLCGALVAPRMTRTVGETKLLPASAIGVALALALAPVALSGPAALILPILAVQSFATSFFGVMYNTIQVTFRQRITPRDLLGRMNASVRFVVSGVLPIAALMAGWLGQEAGIVWTVLIGSSIGLCAIFPISFRTFWGQEHTRAQAAGTGPGS